MEKTELRLDRLEGEMRDVCADLKYIMTNHLPNIQVELEELRGEVKALSTSIKLYGAIIMIALSAVIGLVVAQ